MDTDDIILPYQEFFLNVDRGAVGVQAKELFKAVQGSQISRVKQLLNEGADPNSYNIHGFTPLIIAASDGNNELCEILLNAGANLYARDNCKMTALHWAANFTYTETCKLLLMHGAQVDDKDIYGNTALMYAAGWPTGYSTSKLLIQFAAAPEMKNDQKKRAVDLSEESFNDMFRILLALGNDATQEERDMAANGFQGYWNIMEFLGSPEQIHAEILRGENPQIKRLKQEGFGNALMKRELGGK